MKKGVRLCITGSEVMNGFVLDKNTQFFASELYALGYELKESRILPDNPDAIIRAWQELAQTGDIIVNSGGLGPTSDDLTVDLLCRWLDDVPRYDEYAEKRTRYFFEKRAQREGEKTRDSVHKISLETALRQARLPSRAQPIKNNVGLAPGFYLPQIHFIALPGFPDEIKGMWKETLTLIESLGVEKSATKIIPIWGVGESQLFSMLQPHSEITLGVHALPWGCRLFLRSPSSQNAALDAYRATLEEKFPMQIMENPVVELMNLLKEKRLSLALAESCTGGLAAKQVTDIAGSSAVFKGAAVTYANETKTALVGVSRKILEEHGAVSAPCAKAMAEGASKALDADVTLSFTGIAGPTGGTPTKPVGTVFIGIHHRTEKMTRVARFQFPLGRERFRNATVACGFLAATQMLTVNLQSTVQEKQAYWPARLFA
ncbi:MAG TPA: nicotinamide-nucleotide amidohydrolase family protein [Turneriella sp.]|nr:nicotinamide-nucleotide amidohydrolase family protein [Turneriella sp.]